MENGIKKLVDLGAAAIHRAYILGAKCQDSVAIVHAQRAIIAALEALGLTDEAIDALLERRAAVMPLELSSQNLGNVGSMDGYEHEHRVEIGRECGSS